MKWLVMVLLLLGIIPATVAQDSAPPLIVWSYDGGFLQVYDGTSVAPLDMCAPTGDTYTGFPITFSPDGSHFAYLGLTNNLSRIYVCNVPGRTLVPVADPSLRERLTRVCQSSGLGGPLHRAPPLRKRIQVLGGSLVPAFPVDGLPAGSGARSRRRGLASARPSRNR